MQNTDHSFRPDESDHKYQSWTAFAGSLLGLVLPVGVWFVFEHRLHNDIGWQEGGAWIITLSLLVFLLVTETIVFFRARRIPKDSLPGRLTCWISGTSMALAILPVLYIGAMFLYAIFWIPFINHLSR